MIVFVLADKVATGEEQGEKKTEDEKSSKGKLFCYFPFQKYLRKGNEDWKEMKGVAWCSKKSATQR